ncbi:MAG: hypothetical protein R3326_07950 [Gemmatimonadota bacterium]|nr:hypothetical protein [Gemmatimonadota bacterium]
MNARWRADPAGAGSPVAGIVVGVGRVSGGRLPIPGLDESLGGLLDDARLSRRFDGGVAAAFLVQAPDGRPLHAPCRGRIVAARSAADRRPRLACLLRGPIGTVALLALAEPGGEPISAPFGSDDGGLEGEEIEIDAGDELTAPVPTGSVVIVAFEPGRVVVDPRVRVGERTAVGDPLASAALAVADEIPRGEA